MNRIIGVSIVTFTLSGCAGYDQYVMDEAYNLYKDYPTIKICQDLEKARGTRKIRGINRVLLERNEDCRDFAPNSRVDVNVNN